MKLDTPFHDEVCEFTEIKKRPMTNLELKITELFGTITGKFRILNHCWEMDGYGYVVSDGVKNKIIVTDHTKPYEVGVEHLKYKIRDYEAAISDTKDVIKLFENGNN